MKFMTRIADAWRALAGHQRNELPLRRDCEHFNFEHNNFQWTASIGRYPNGKLAEIFLTNSKQGTTVEYYAQDASIATSIALQYGAPLETLQSAMSRDGRNVPHCAIGVALDLLVAESTNQAQPG